MAFEEVDWCFKPLVKDWLQEEWKSDGKNRAGDRIKRNGERRMDMLKRKSHLKLNLRYFLESIIYKVWKKINN